MTIFSMNYISYLKALGRYIREKRTKLGYSQEAFADEIGVHRTYMGSIERGEKNFSLKNLIKVVDGLGITPAKMMNETEKSYLE